MSPFDILKCPLGNNTTPSGEPLVQRVHRRGAGQPEALGDHDLVCNLLSKSQRGKILAISETRRQVCGLFILLLC